MPFRMKHLVCGGTGIIDNPDFEDCRHLSEEERPKNCEACRKNHSLIYELCHRGERIQCVRCRGQGYLDFDVDEWEAPVWV